MATKKKYNPYDDVKAIVHQKSLYDQAKAEGKDPSQHQQDAVQYYNNLRNNNYGDAADKLVTYGYKDANDYLNNNFQPTREYDEWYDNITGDLVQQQANNEIQSETVRNLMDTYNNNNNILNGSSIVRDADGNVVSGLRLDHYNKGNAQMDYINNYDITSQPWYNSLMQGYQLQGQDAANGALASGASSNSGNIDSYAAANANRQQLAFTNAGNEAARAMALQNMQAWQNVYDSVSNDLNLAGQQYNDQLSKIHDFYATDSDERQNALNKSADLEKQKLQNQIDELMYNLQAETDRYTSDNTLTGTLDSNAKNLEGTKITSANDLAAAIREAEAKEYAANQDYNGVVYKTNNGTSSSGSDSNGLDKDLSLDESAAQFRNDILEGVSTITSWDELRDALVDGGYNLAKINDLIKSYQKTYPNLFQGVTTTAQLPELKYDENGNAVLPDGFELPSSYSTKAFHAHLKNYMNGRG